jgi:hypothetical protein
LNLRTTSLVNLVKPYFKDWFKANLKTGAVTRRIESGETRAGDAIKEASIREANEPAATRNTAVDDSHKIVISTGGIQEASTADLKLPMQRHWIYTALRTNGVIGE